MLFVSDLLYEFFCLLVWCVYVDACAFRDWIVGFGSDDFCLEMFCCCLVHGVCF